jgi:hypothetical protein
MNQWKVQDEGISQSDAPLFILRQLKCRYCLLLKNTLHILQSSSWPES